MNDTQPTPATTGGEPRDPVMAASDPTMFAALTFDENVILNYHLKSGWYKQSAVYPPLAEPWRETCALFDDLRQALRPPPGWRADREPEAGQ